MRKDMNKVLTERGRVGGNDGQKHDRTYKHKLRVREKQYYKNIELDERPTKESMRRRHVRGGSTKEPAYHAKPLKRYLLSQVGRKWDDVWSEICQATKGYTLQAQYAKNYVGGIPHSGQTYFTPEDWWNPRRSLVYVDEDGILRKGEGRRRLRAKDLRETYGHVRESDLVEYHKINGCWYRLEGWTKEEMSRLLRTFCFSGWSAYYKTYYKTKKALSKREARRLDLENRLSKYPPNLKP